MAKSNGGPRLSTVTACVICLFIGFAAGSIITDRGLLDSGPKLDFRGEPAEDQATPGPRDERPRDEVPDAAPADNRDNGDNGDNGGVADDVDPMEPTPTEPGDPTPPADDQN